MTPSGTPALSFDDLDSMTFVRSRDNTWYVVAMLNDGSKLTSAEGLTDPTAAMELVCTTMLATNLEGKIEDRLLAIRPAEALNPPHPESLTPLLGLKAVDPKQPRRRRTK